MNLGQVESPRREYGYNEIPEHRENPAILFLGRFRGLTPWTFELTAIPNFILHRELETAFILGLLIFNGVRGFVQESRTNAALEYIKRRLHISARVKCLLVSP